MAPIGVLEHLGGGFGKIFSEIGDGSGGAVAETFSMVYATQTGRDQGVLKGNSIRGQGGFPSLEARIHGGLGTSRDILGRDEMNVGAVVKGSGLDDTKEREGGIVMVEIVSPEGSP